MKYIGGQTYIICAMRKLLMVHVPDRKANYKCGRNEHLLYTEPNCLNYICWKCADHLDANIVNEIQNIDDGSNDNSNNDDNSQKEDNDNMMIVKMKIRVTVTFQV